jgi:hypothetical protein
VTPAGFVAAYGDAADQAAAASGLSRWSVLTQWALETGWCAPNSGCSCANLAGITCHGACSCNGAGFCCYPNTAPFAADYAGVLHNGLYGGVLGAAGSTIRQELQALGRSPWAGSHYDNGGGPGSSLVGLYGSLIQPLAGIGLDDSLTTAAAPPPPPEPSSPPPPVIPPIAVGGASGAAALLLLGAGAAAVAFAERRRPGTLARLQHDLVALMLGRARVAEAG